MAGIRTWAWPRAAELSVDSAQFVAMGQQVRTGQRIYRPWLEFGVHRTRRAGFLVPPDRTSYPPVVPALASHLPPLDPGVFARARYLVLLGAFWLYAALLARMATGRAGARNVLVAGLVLMLTPGSWHAVAVGNVDPILWVLFGCALAFPRLRGAGLAAAALVKAYAVWPLRFAIARERSRILRSAGRVFAAGMAVGVAAFGVAGFFAACRAWLRYVPPMIGQGSFEFWNFSLTFAALRLLYATGLLPYPAGPLGGPVLALLTVAGVAGPLLAGILTRRLRPEYQYGSIMAAAVLFSPICWANYLPMLYAPAAVWMSERRRHLSAGPIRRPALVERFIGSRPSPHVVQR